MPTSPVDDYGFDDGFDEEDAEEVAVARRIGTTAPRTVPELWQKASKERAWRIQLAHQSLAFFAWWYLRARGKPVAVPRCHLRWYRKFGTGDGYRKSKTQRKLLLLAPRSHGKSHASGWVLPLHRICCQRNIRILMLGASATAATKWLRRIRKQLESNPRILADFGEVDLGNGKRSTGFKSLDAPWSDHRIQVQRGDESLADATVEATGAGSAITGGRFDLIIADDPESDKTVLSDHVRRQTRQWFRATITELLEPWGEILVIGTRKHNDDLYAHLLKDKLYEKEIYRAIEPEIPPHEFITDDNGAITGVRVLGDKAQYQVLWPEVWPLESLLLKRESLTAILFARENQQEVVSGEDAAFQWDWLLAARNRGQEMARWATTDAVPEDWFIVQAADPAFVDDPDKAQRSDSDYFFHITVAVHRYTWHRRILRLWRKRGLTPGDYTRRIRTSAGYYTRPTDPFPAGSLKWLVVERNSFGKHYEIGLRQGSDLPLIPHHTSQLKADPYQGVEAMASLFQNGQISWAMGPLTPDPDADPPDPKEVRREQAEYEQTVEAMMGELFGLGSEKHDDSLMALWLAEIAIRKLKRTMEAAGGRRQAERRGHVRPGEVDELTKPRPRPPAVVPYEERPEVLARIGQEEPPSLERPSPPRPQEPRPAEPRPAGWRPPAATTKGAPLSLDMRAQIAAALAVGDVEEAERLLRGG